MRTRKITGFLGLVVVVLAVLAGAAAAENPSVAAVEKININTAPLETLMQLNGVGEAYAKRIIEYRETQGSFSHIEELKNVRGIGERLFEKNKDRITVGMETTGAGGQRGK